MGGKKVVVEYPLDPAVSHFHDSNFILVPLKILVSFLFIFFKFSFNSVLVPKIMLVLVFISFLIFAIGFYLDFK